MKIRPNIQSLIPYSTARDEFHGGDISIWLDANESPYDNGVNRYPDPHQKHLKQAIAQLKNVSTDNLFIGNGSDEAIDLCYRIFCEPSLDNVVAISPTYGMYAVAAAINNVEVREVALEMPNYSLSTAKMLAATDENTRLMWICSPNNPTGNSFPLSQIEELLQCFQGMVVVDEAYIDFSSQTTALSLLSRYNNLIVLQTLSKAWGMAGLRLGLAFADKFVAELFDRVKYPYNINVSTQEEVVKRLQSEPHDLHVKEICEQRDYLRQVLPTLSCVEKVFPSDANFLLVRVSNTDDIYAALVRSGIIVRNRNHIKGCESCLRITVGTPQQDEQLLACLKRYSI